MNVYAEQAVSGYTTLQRVRMAIYRTMNLCHASLKVEDRWQSMAHEKLARVESHAGREATLFLAD